MEEVARLQRALTKAQENMDWARMVDVLNTLSETEVTVATLEELKIGAVVAKYRKHTEATIAEAAKALVKKWKQLASEAGVPGNKPEETTKKADRRPKETTSRDESSKASSSSSSSKAASSLKGPPLEKKKSTLGFRSEVGDFRENSRRRFLEVLKEEEIDEVCYEVAEAVEEAMARAFPAYGSDATAKREYLGKLRQLVFNVKKNSNLRDSLRAGEIEADDLVKMSVEELATKELREERQRMRDFQHDARSLDWDKRNRDRLMKAIGIDESKGMFQCSKCKSKRISNHAKQTRSADEPMTQFFECADCGNRWRF